MYALTAVGHLPAGLAPPGDGCSSQWGEKGAHLPLLLPGALPPLSRPEAQQRAADSGLVGPPDWVLAMFGGAVFLGDD